MTESERSRGLGAAGMVGPGKIALAEGITAAVSEYSQDDNVTGQIVKKLPWTKAVFGAIATGDDDHPLLLTFKNVIEEMGIADSTRKIKSADLIDEDRTLLEKGEKNN